METPTEYIASYIAKQKEITKYNAIGRPALAEYLTEQEAVGLIEDYMRQYRADQILEPILFATYLNKHYTRTNPDYEKGYFKIEEKGNINFKTYHSMAAIYAEWRIERQSVLMRRSSGLSLPEDKE